MNLEKFKFIETRKSPMKIENLFSYRYHSYEYLYEVAQEHVGMTEVEFDALITDGLERETIEETHSSPSKVFKLLKRTK